MASSHLFRATQDKGIILQANRCSTDRGSSHVLRVANTPWDLEATTGNQVSNNSRNMVAELTKMEVRDHLLLKEAQGTVRPKTTHTCTNSNKFSSKATCRRTLTLCQAVEEAHMIQVRTRE